MSNFIASNGVKLDKNGNVFGTLSGSKEVHEARKEFYQRLRDKELGRWRDPEAPNFVVYPEDDDRVLVLNELDGVIWHYRRDYSPDTTTYGHVATRYFAAHPVKPWHDAKPGEAWVLAAHDDADEYPYVTDSNGRFIDENFVTHKPEDFVSGRRIWPEGDSDG